MNLSGIIAISGKPGLYKVIAQGKNNIIVESIEEKKRVPAYATDRISALDDISIYTYDDDKPLKEIFDDIFKKENGGATISHKEDAKKLQAYLTEILPEYDKERVYPSDIKKLFQWYNLLHKAGELKMDEVEEAPAKAEKAPKAPKADKEAKDAKPAKETKEKAAVKKAPAAKKTTEKAVTPKASAKTTSAKKVAAPKTGASRGK
jgi:hypothetical protein